MKLYLKYYFLLFICIFAISCSENTAPLNYKRSQSNEIMPLAVGNFWKYKITSSDDLQNGTVYTLKVLKEIIIDGRTEFELNQSNLRYIDFYSDVRVNTSNGLEQNYYLYDGSREFQLLYKYPARLGDVFSTPIDNMNNITNVISTNKLITTPAGTFPCYEYKNISKEALTGRNFDTIGTTYNERINYCAVGVGLIKSVTKTKTIMLNGEIMFEGIDTDELIEYNVK